MMRDTKDNIIIATAVVTLVSGIVLSFLSFFLSEMHEISSSVLWYFAQCLMYSASAFGIYGYVHAKVTELQKIVKNESV